MTAYQWHGQSDMHVTATDLSLVSTISLCLATWEQNAAKHYLFCIFLWPTHQSEMVHVICLRTDSRSIKFEQFKKLQS